jgi:hypothetical protein
MRQSFQKCLLLEQFTFEIRNWLWFHEKKKEIEKIYIQMSRYTDDVTGFVMTADFDVTSTTLDASSCRYALYIRVCDCGVGWTG